MSSARPLSVLISEPGCREVPPFLPYMWAVLKSYHERHGETGDAVRWLPPLHGSGSVDSLLHSCGDSSVDVLGLSCYMWNWHVQYPLAERIKARNPQCVVVAGGPEPDYRDPQFFQRYPCIDIVVAKDGEIAFSRILREIVGGGGDFRRIAGLYLPSTEGHGFAGTGPAEVVTTFDYSPYLDQRGYFEREFRAKAHGEIAAIWETTRGCPYSCSFCDWGSATMSKLRRFDIGRVEAELDFLAWMGVDVLFMADANFGILPRDVEIAEMVTAAYARHGSPRYFAYSNAKNNPDRSVAISRKLYAAGVTLKHELSIQHTRKEVLAATDRANISPEQQLKVVRQLLADGVPIDVQLIRGIPGDTYELAKRCLADLMELGIHETYQVYPYLLLPNAPAADPAFVARWRIGTVRRYTFTTADGKRAPDDVSWAPRSNTVVESATFSRADWVRMNVYSAFALALHNASLTRLIAIYLRFSHGVPYHDFYEGVIEDFCARAAPAAGWHRRLAGHYEAYLANDEAIDFMEVDGIPEYRFRLQPYRWTIVQVCLRFAEFFEGLKDYLGRRYPSAPNLNSLIDFQRQMVILPSYDREAGRTFTTDCDWMEYFAAARRSMVPAPLGEPEYAPGSIVEISDRTCTDDIGTYELNWTGTERERWPVWVDRVVVGYAGNSQRRTNFQRVRLRSPSPVA
jgi:putative methyltransferase